ncbi:MAG: DUF1566 domain-containing protein [Nitrospiraceae bacterium]|nr:MAG: DUF1566 domain-containing protein [Nitrospiraceae bacterium]
MTKEKIMIGKIVTISIWILFLAANGFADDVSIDSSGNIRTGVANANAELEVTGASGEGGILGSASGTGASGVYGINTTSGNYGILGYDSYGVFGFSSSGWAGYFQGNTRVTGNLTIDGSVIGPSIGDITGVTAGTGLTGGAAGGNATLNADTAYLQRRVSSSCTVGSSIRAINEDGTVVCESVGGGTVAESDPEVGSNTLNYVPRWDGSAMITGSIYDNGTVGIGSQSDLNYKLYVSRTSGDFGAGRASIYGYRYGSSGVGLNGGTGWSLSGVDAAVKGFSDWGNNYTAGVAGYSYLDYEDSAAVIGAHNDGNLRGMLGYKDRNNDLWAGYFEGNVRVNGALTFQDGSIQTTAGTQALCLLYRSLGTHPPAFCFSRMSDTGQTGDFTAVFGEDSDYSILPPSYNDNGNGTVTDNVSGLMWQKEDNNTTYKWAAALTYCGDLALGGYSDWRLPDEFELMGIVDYGTYNPSINTTYFPGTEASGYWSSTPYANDSSSAWDVYFYSGDVSYYSKSGNYYVRCVRGGQ